MAAFEKLIVAEKLNFSELTLFEKELWSVYF